MAIQRREDVLEIRRYLRMKGEVSAVFETAPNTEKSATVNQIANALSPAASVEDLGAARTLLAKDSGKTFFLALAGGLAVTLPTPAAGLRFKFIVKTAPSGGDYTVVAASGADIIIGGISELEVDTGDDGPYDNNADTITLNDGVAVVGDYVELISDGTSWYLNGQTNADGGITLSTT